MSGQPGLQSANCGSGQVLNPPRSADQCRHFMNLSLRNVLLKLDTDMFTDALVFAGLNSGGLVE